MLGPTVVPERPAEGRWVSRDTRVQLGVVTRAYNPTLGRQWQEDQGGRTSLAT